MVLNEKINEQKLRKKYEKITNKLTKTNLVGTFAIKPAVTLAIKPAVTRSRRKN